MSYSKDALTRHIKIDELPEMLTYELGRSRRYGSPLGVLRVRVRVEDVNRRYEVMGRYAHCCLDVIRTPDRGFRHGENLIYVLPQTPADGMGKVAGKLHAQLDELGKSMEGVGEVTDLMVESVCYTPAPGEGKVTAHTLLGAFHDLSLGNIAVEAEAAPERLSQLYPSLTITRHPR